MIKKAESAAKSSLAADFSLSSQIYLSHIFALGLRVDR